MKDLLRRLEEANPAMRNFKSSYWWFDDLSFIRDHHLSYVIVGDGRMELSPKRAGLLSKKGYIDIVQHRMGRRASLTREGKKKLSQAQDIYDGLVEGLEESLSDDDLVRDISRMIKSKFRQHRPRCRYEGPDEDGDVSVTMTLEYAPGYEVRAEFEVSTYQEDDDEVMLELEGTSPSSKIDFDGSMDATIRLRGNAKALAWVQNGIQDMIDDIMIEVESAVSPDERGDGRGF